jgi:excisionase family DNA binding protein
MEAAMEKNTLLTVGEVAHYLHVVTMTVYRMINRGDLKAVKVGRVWRVRWQDIERYLDRPAGLDVSVKGAES